MPSASSEPGDLDNYDKRGQPEGPSDWSDPGYDSVRLLVDREGDALANIAPWSMGKANPEDGPTPELTELTSHLKRFTLLEHFKAQTYVRSQDGWLLHGAAFTFQPIVGRLENQLLLRLSSEDRVHDDPAELVRRAWIGMAIGHLERVVDLTLRVTRALVRPPTATSRGAVVAPEWRREALAAAAMLCSARRQSHESGAALDDTDIFGDEEYPPLMTTRAAAMCDVGLWDDAHALATRARDLRGSVEAFHVLERIERHSAQLRSRQPTASLSSRDAV